MGIILDEKKYAENLLENGLEGGKVHNSLNILARYYYYIHGYRRKKISEMLEQFMLLNYDKYRYNTSWWDDVIDSTARKAGRKGLLSIEGIYITHKELEKISSIKNNVLERLAFTLLCLAKLGNAKSCKNNGWVNLGDKDIYKLARITCSVAERDYKLHDLLELGLIELPKRPPNMSVRVSFINDNSKNKLFISDFRELGYEYLKYKGQNFVRCANCGILVRGNKYNTKKYCSACSKYIKLNKKILICVDCGKEFITDNMANKKIRCDKCQETYRKKIINENAKKYYISKKKQ